MRRPHPGPTRTDSLFPYTTLFRSVAVWNSLVVAGISTVLAMFFGTIAAYSLVRFRTGGEHLALWIISQRMMPPIVIVFPIFLLYVWLGGVDKIGRAHV